jgi:hypothetical protein
MVALVSSFALVITFLATLAMIASHEIKDAYVESGRVDFHSHIAVLIALLLVFLVAVPLSVVAMVAEGAGQSHLLPCIMYTDHGGHGGRETQGGTH